MMTTWRTRAQCRIEGTDPEVFFPVSEVGPGARQVAEAKTVCARCPVAAACLTDALDSRLEYGVFGGLTASERRNLVGAEGMSPRPHEWALAA